ncbi:MAG: sulfatase-like hydrolase/transferase [Planctomycetota bacterium]|nr:sulfatase-like hydrolase/transferase [Planctomycetota bacterium]
MAKSIWPRGLRTRLLLSLWVILMGVGAATRIGLALHGSLGSRPGELLQVLAAGAGYDALVGLVLLTPIALFLALRSGERERPRLRFVLLTVFAAAAVFGGFVEYFFFDEFDARFNHVALDYLLFPGEVAGNVWESYPVPLYVGLALLAGAGCAFGVQRFLRGSVSTPRAWPRRALHALAALGAGAGAVALLSVIPPLASGNRATDEVAANGLVQLVRAFQTASLDYASYYRTVPEPEFGQLVRSEVGLPNIADPVRQFRAVERREKPLDVVVILGESFGSEFVGRLGGAKPCAPGLERWADRGLFLTNVVPTGNRTVRGLEGVLCSFVPLPGDSIWKRDKSDDVASIARVLKDQGYRTEFVYGGDGAFDGMKSFALRNGWDQFHEDSLVGESSYPEDAFRTIWGVADEHMYDALLEHQRAAAREGVPLFATALTVSNHKPFLTPDSTSGLRGAKLVTAAWQAAILLVLSALAWRFLAKPGRRASTATVITIVWTGFLVAAWTEAQPRDTRVAAVRYSDRTLAEYLDRAKAEGLLDHTVVLFVGDHGARVYGSEEIPAASYRVPALFVAPDAKYAGKTIPRLCSQVDLAPTLLSLAGIDYAAPFFGSDLLSLPPDAPGRAWLIHNRNIGLLTDTSLTVLGLRGTTTFYRRDGRESDRFERIPESPALLTDADRAAAVFQAASLLYEGRRYRLPHVP